MSLSCEMSAEKCISCGFNAERIEGMFEGLKITCRVTGESIVVS